MSETIEDWDLYDANGKFVRTMRRGKDYVPQKLYHNTVEVIATDRAGHMLVTQRSTLKRHGAGKWEFPAGSVISGETIPNAALRELKEETGLVPKRLKKLQERRIPGLNRTAFFADVPTLLREKITLQEDETIAYRFVTVSEWLDLIAQGAFAVERVKMYDNKFYAAVLQYVGTITQLPKKPPTKKTMRPVQSLK